MKSRLVLAGLLALAVPAAAQTGVDSAGAGKLIEEGMQRSEVMQNLQYLSDVIGPRLTGSAAARKANDWTSEKFKSYGLESHLEEWNFGIGWSRGPAQFTITAPFTRNLVGHSWAWTEGTGGKVLEGPVVRVDITNADSMKAYASKIKGAWLMTANPSNIWNPDGPPMTAADSAAMQEARRRGFGGPQNQDTSAAARKARQQLAIDRPYMLKQMGALGQLQDGGKEQGLMNMSGSPYAVSPLPRMVIAHEDYAMFDRLIKMGQTPRISGSISNSFTKAAVPQWNTVAEIKGSEKPGEVVIVGGHLDSWDLGTGTTDNGAGSMTVLEAARIIAKSGLKPKRTLRFILFTGEEEGLLGSVAYAAQHAATMDSIQAVLVLDNGTGAITGMSLQGRSDDAGLWKDLFAAVAPLDTFVVKDGNKGGTDHLSFIPYGVPGWNYDQITRGYNHTHHSQVDTYDHAVSRDLMQASTVMAVTAYELANLPALLPRGPKTPVTPREVMPPSPEFTRKK